TIGEAMNASPDSHASDGSRFAFEPLSPFAAVGPKSTRYWGIMGSHRHTTASVKEEDVTFANNRAASTLALIALVAATAATAQMQQVYRYVDPEGRVVYSDKPPPPNAREAQAKRIGKNMIETSDMSFSAAMAQERFPVTLYTFGCGTVCDTA